MKYLLLKITIMAVLLVTLGGCFVGWGDEGRGGRGGGHDGGGGHDRGGEHGEHH